MVIQTSVALALVAFLYPTTSSRLYKDACLSRANASEGDKYNAICLTISIYYRDTHCYSEHFYEPLRSKKDVEACEEDYDYLPNWITCTYTHIPEFGKDEVDALSKGLVDRLMSSYDNYTAECIKNGTRTVLDRGIATTTTYDTAPVSFIGVVSDYHTKATFGTEDTFSTGTTAVQGTSTSYIDTIISSAIVTGTTDNNTATVSGIDGIGTQDSERERIRRQSEDILGRAKLRLFVISFIMTVVLAVQFLLIKRFRELSREFYEEKKKESIMSEVEDLYEMGNRDIKKVKQPTSGDKDATLHNDFFKTPESFKKLRQRLSVAVLGQPGKNP